MDRREFLRTAVSTGMAIGLAGCGGGRQPPETSTAATRTSPPDTRVRTTARTTEPERTVYAGLLDSAEVAAIKKQVRAGNNPWRRGYTAQLTQAKRALDASPRSVVDNGAPEGIDEHRFATGADRVDYKVALDMGRWIRNLGLGYAFTGENKYAQKAIDLIDHWFVAPDTRMHPSGKNYGETYFSIELHITVPKMIYGVSLVTGHPYWQEVDGGESAVREWVRAYLDDMEAGAGENLYDGSVNNNIYAWWILGRATAAAYLDDRDSLTAAFDDWRANALEQLEPSGALKYERQRENGLLYSLYGLKALTLTAEVARHYGVDLYGYSPDGTAAESALKRVFTYYAQYFQDPDAWEWGLGDGTFSATEREEGASVYELANSQWPSETYRRVIRSSGRPVYDRRILGWTTLTHADRFDLDKER